MSLSLSLSRARLDSLCRTRCLVLPMGAMPRHVFEEYLADMRRVGSIMPMAQLTYHAPSKDTPFKSINWKRGRMLFEFIDGSVPASEAASAPLVLSPSAGPPRVEAPMPAGAQWTDLPPPVQMVSAPSSLSLSIDWDELRASDKVMAVLCVVHCPSTSLDSAQVQFDQVRAQLLHPGGPFVYKVWAWAPSSAQVAPRPGWNFLGGAADLSRGGGGASSSPGGGGGDDAAHADFVLSTLLHSLCLTLLDNFEASIKKLPAGADLRSPLESSEKSTTPGGSEGRGNKKVRPGRQRKFVGDYCLLAGDPRAALGHYKASESLSRGVGDFVWVSQSVEGVAAALDALQHEEVAPGWSGDVVQALEDSLAALSRCPFASMLALESSFRLARYQGAWGRTLEAAQVLVGMYERKVDCSAHDQIALAVEAGITMFSMGFKRRGGFFLVQAAGLYRELHQSASCHALLRAAAPAFKIDGFALGILDAKTLRRSGDSSSDDSDFDDEEDDPPRPALVREQAVWEKIVGIAPVEWYTALRSMSPAKQAERGVLGGKWVHLVKQVLEHMIYSGRLMSPPSGGRVVAHVVVYLLSSLHQALDGAYQASLVSDLVAATKGEGIDVPVSGGVPSPVVQWIRPLLCDESTRALYDPLDDAKEEDGVDQAGSVGCSRRLRRAEDALAAAGGGSIFLSRPDFPSSSASSSQRHQVLGTVRVVQGEVLSFEVMLSNTLKVGVVVQSASLQTRGASFAACSSSFTLLAESSQVVVLSGVPLEAGELSVKGVKVRVWNMMSMHRVDKHGRGAGAEKSSTSVDNLLSVRHIEVLPPLPLLSFRYDLSGNLSDHLLLGETRQACVTLVNTGSVEVGDIEFAAEAMYVSGSKQSQEAYYQLPDEIKEIEENMRKKEQKNMATTPRKVLSVDAATPSSARRTSAVRSARASAAPAARPLITFDPAAIKAQLPLKPGAVMRVQVEITAHTECCGARFILSYAADTSSRNFRCIQYPVAWKVENGLLLKNLHVYHFASGSSSAKAVAGAAVAGTQNSPSPWSLDASPFSATATSPTAAEVAAALPSHLSHELDQMTARDCMLILELTNSSTANFRLTCTVDGSPYKTRGVLIDKSSDKRIILPLPRMSFGDADSDKYLQRLANTPVTKETADAWRSDDRYRALLQRFHERVKLSWTSSEESRGSLAGMSAGSAGQAAVEISPVHLARLLPDSIEFQSSLTPVDPPQAAADFDPMHGSPVFTSPKFSPISAAVAAAAPLPVLSSGTRAMVGAFHRLSVTLVNHTHEDRHLDLTIQPFQESVNGRLDTSLQNKVLVVGTLCHSANVAPGGQATHELLVCFTAVGRFNFQFTARQREQSEQISIMTTAPDLPADDADPYALLAAIAKSTATPLRSSSASASAAPTPHHHTVRRRSTVAASGDQAELAAAATAAFDVNNDSQYELDVDSDSDDDGEAREEESRRQTAAASARTRKPSAELTLQSVMVVQACLQ